MSFNVNIIVTTQYTMIRTLTLGTDCTGIDAAYNALRNILPADMSIRYKFASEIDPKLREYIRRATNPEVIYNDLTNRPVHKMEAVDIYVAGFPCQTFSTCGTRKGFDDARGTIIFHIIEYLRAHPPRVFILENVKGLLSHDNGRTFVAILNQLKDALPNFQILHFLLSPTDIGFPQSRERVFIIGHREQPQQFEITPLDSPVRLDDLLLSHNEAKLYHPNCCRKLTPQYVKQFERVSASLQESSLQMVNLGLSKSWRIQMYTDCCPCLIKHCYTFYIVNQQRFLTAIEALRIQGFEDASVASYLDLFNPQNKNRGTACLWAANSICIPVLEQILRSLMPALVAQKN